LLSQKANDLCGIGLQVTQTEPSCGSNDRVRVGQRDVADDGVNALGVVTRKSNGYGSHWQSPLPSKPYKDFMRAASAAKATGSG
jgi:hypothetical protein